jgi:hypothetical protein
LLGTSSSFRAHSVTKYRAKEACTGDKHQKSFFGGPKIFIFAGKKFLATDAKVRLLSTLAGAVISVIIKIKLYKKLVFYAFAKKRAQYCAKLFITTACK